MDKELKGHCDGWDIFNNRSGGARRDDLGEVQKGVSPCPVRPP